MLNISANNTVFSKMVISIVLALSVIISMVMRQSGILILANKNKHTLVRGICC